MNSARFLYVLGDDVDEQFVFSQQIRDLDQEKFWYELKQK